MRFNRPASVYLRAKKTPTDVVSTEEQELLVEEASRNLSQAQEIDQDIDRMEDTAEAMEDLTRIAENIPEASPDDILMVDVAQRLAVAGSDVDSEEITPALEQYEGKQISMEGTQQMVNEIWEAIEYSVRGIYDKINLFFYNTNRALPKLEESISSVQERREGAGKPERKTITLGCEYPALIVGGKLVEYPQQLVEAYRDLRDQLKYYMKSEPSDIERMGHVLHDKLRAFDLKEGRKHLADMVQALANFEHTVEKPKSMEAHQVRDARFAEGEYVRYNALPCNVSVFYRQGFETVSEQAGYNQLLNAAEGVRRSVATVDYTTSSNGLDRELKREDPILLTAPATPEQVGELMSLAQEIIALVRSYEQDQAWSNIRKVRENIMDAAENLRDQAQQNDNVTSVEVQFFRSAIRFSKYYTTVSTQPMASLSAFAIQACRGLVVYANKSLSA